MYKTTFAPRWLFLLILCLALSAGRTLAAGPFKVDGETYVPVGNNPASGYAVRLRLGPPRGKKELSELAVLFGADQEGNGYHFEVSGDRWKLRSVRDGRSSALAAGKQGSLPATKPVEIQIRHHVWLVQISMDGRVVAEVQDDSQGKGLVAVAAGKSSPAGKPVVQPLKSVKFAENFMRAEGEIDLPSSKIWNVESGNWQIHSVREEADTVNVEQLAEGRKPQKERSPNPFSVSAHAEESGLLWSGRWFWDDYRAAVSIRNLGAEAVGLAFNVKDKTDFFLLRWENNSPVLGATPIELVRVKNGQKERLKRVWVNGQRREWFEIAVRTCGSRIQAELDESLIMDIHHPESIGGGVGLYVEGGNEEGQAFFDDVTARTLTQIAVTDTDWISRHTRSEKGEWEPKAVQQPARPTIYVPRLKSNDGRLVLGNSRWLSPMLRAEVPVPETGQQLGFLAGMRGATDGRWRVTLGRQGKHLTLSIDRERGEDVKSLGQCSDIPLPGQDTVEMEADFSREGEINVRVAGRLQLHVQRDGSAAGAPAIFGKGASGAQFGDLHVFFRPPVDKERLPAEEIFREDPYMKHWSSAQGSWWPAEDSEDAFWHVGDFYGRSDIEIPLNHQVLLIHAADKIHVASGYAVRLKKVTDKELKFYQLTLHRQGKKVAESTVEEQNIPDDKVVLHKDGRYIWATAGQRELWCYRDENPLPGKKLAVQGISGDELDDLTIHRYQVKDYYFESAPSDWLSVGRWKVTNRFVCDPRWSHMAGMSRSAGILFNKYKYRGDLTMEAFMGMRMRPAMRNYPRVGDLNMAMNTTPYDLTSGYKFVLAGWDEFWSERATYLLKGARQLAYCGERLLPGIRRPGERARVIDVPWIKGGRAVHGAWYYLKARKQGGRLQFFVDNHKAYEYKDPEPYEEVAPSIWTYDAWVVVARVKVSYEEKVIPGRLVSAPAGRDDVEKKPAGLHVTSSSHPGMREDFEGGLGAWAKFNDLHGAQPEIVPREGGGHALRAINERAGGTFGVEVPISDLDIDAATADRLRFDYRIPRDSKINLYTDIGGNRYFIQLTGPEDSDTLLRRLGKIDIKADGQWHTAEFNLAAAWRNLHDGSEAGLTPIRQTVFGNLHSGLLAAGLEGNSTNAIYEIDNFEVSSRGENSFKGSARVPGSEVRDLLTVVDQSPDTIPTETGEPVRDGLSPGEWYWHVRARLQDGSLTKAVHFPFRVTPQKLVLEDVRPGDGGKWGYGPIQFQLGEGQSLHVHKSKLNLSVNDQEVTTYPGLYRLDCATDMLEVDLSRADLQVKDGEPCQIALSHPNPDGTSGEMTVSYTASLKADKTPPGRVELAGVLGTNDFESGTGSWKSTDGVGIVRDDSTAASGEWSLMVQNHNFANSATTYVTQDAFSAGHVPAVAFDYKIHDAVRIDLGLHNSLGTCTIGLTDKSQQGHYLGSVSNVRGDNRWHHVEVDLLERLQKMSYRPGLYRQQNMVLADYGHRAMAPGAYYHVDNFRPIPLVSRHTRSGFRVEAHDAAGIAGYSFVWSEKPEQEPDDKVDDGEPLALPENPPEPRAYLHIKARDRAGNWGPTSHILFRTDTGAPRLANASPAEGAKSASSTISFRVTDEGAAVDPEKLTVKIDGRTYGPASRGVDYSPASGDFKWDWVDGAPRDQKGIPNGQKINVEVAATDFAGNTAEPTTWSWTMDYSRDKRSPTVPEVSCATMPTKAWTSFETGTGDWRPMRNDHWGANIKRIARDRKTGDHCLRISAKRSRSFMNVYAHRGAYDLTKFPLVSFEYLIPKAARFNMFVRLHGKWHEIPITSPQNKWKKLGKAEGIKADGKWRQVTIDLRRIVRDAYPNAKKLRVQNLAFGDNSRHNSRKSYWLVDNFLISGYGEPNARFAWSARDITGIAGYAAGLVEKSTGGLAEKITHKGEEGAFTIEKPGSHWLKVKARDNGGNWGPSVTMPYVVKPESKEKQ